MSPEFRTKKRIKPTEKLTPPSFETQQNSIHLTRQFHNDNPRINTKHFRSNIQLRSPETDINPLLIGPRRTFVFQIIETEHAHARRHEDDVVFWLICKRQANCLRSPHFGLGGLSKARPLSCGKLFAFMRAYAFDDARLSDTLNFELSLKSLLIN